MKKSLILTLCFVFFSFAALAGKFVLIPVSETNNLETLFSNSALKIHYYSDDYVLATTDISVKGMIVLDEAAFSDVNEYAIVYCSEDFKEEYLSKIAGSVETLYSGKHFFIMKLIGEGFVPAKGDGMVAITNTEARMLKTRYDYPVITEPDENVQNFISQVSSDSAMGYIQTLENFVSRNALNANHVLARNWIKQQYEDMGNLDVSLHNFNWYYGNNDNVIAIQYGTEFPDEYIVLGGHYDSYTYESQSNAPGADDNASGSAGIMETARILSQYEFKRSIIYCTFSAEEYGLYGSAAYAQKCVNEGKNILGYFNLDMIGYLTEGDPIHFCLIFPNNPALSLANYFINVCNVYFPTIPVTTHTNLPWGDSDHTSFNNRGIPGIWWFEDINCDCPYIHHIAGVSGCGTNCTGSVPCQGDVIGPSVNNPEQVKAFIQAMVASVATLAELAGEITQYPPPENCLAEYVQDMNIKVSWIAPPVNTPVDEYHVYRDGVQIAQLTELSYTDIVEDYQEYCYTVTALFSEIETIHSNESCASVPMPLFPPINCNANYVENTGIVITWNAPEANNPDKYYVYRDNEKIAQETALTYTDTPADYELHCYQISAVYGEEESEFSNESCAAIVSVAELSNDFKIYPNPTTGELIIDNGQLTINNVEVYNIIGKKQKIIVNYQLSTVNCSHLPTGVYFIKIDGRFVGKFVKE